MRCCRLHCMHVYTGKKDADGWLFHQEVLGKYYWQKYPEGLRKRFCLKSLSCVAFSYGNAGRAQAPSQGLHPSFFSKYACLLAVQSADLGYLNYFLLCRQFYLMFRLYALYFCVYEMAGCCISHSIPCVVKFSSKQPMRLELICS